MKTDDPGLLPRDALSGVTIGLSVSDSADLSRLGLDDRHAELAIGEITRAVLLAGGKLAYGGHLGSTGFTRQLMNEVQRFGTARHSVTFHLALPDHSAMSRDELGRIDSELGTWGRLVTLDIDGAGTDWRNVEAETAPLSDTDRVAAYSGLRRHMADNVHGRILVGGRLRGYVGAMPGLVEEAILAVQRKQPVYAAGGFGGAAAATARRLDAGQLSWLPPGLPEGEDDAGVQAALEQLESAAAEVGWRPADDGLDDEQRALLSSSHRPGEIASLCVVGLAARFSTTKEQR